MGTQDTEIKVFHHILFHDKIKGYFTARSSLPSLENKNLLH